MGIPYGHHQLGREKFATVLQYLPPLKQMDTTSKILSDVASTWTSPTI